MGSQAPRSAESTRIPPDLPALLSKQRLGSGTRGQVPGAVRCPCDRHQQGHMSQLPADGIKAPGRGATGPPASFSWFRNLEFVITSFTSSFASFSHSHSGLPEPPLHTSGEMSTSPGKASLSGAGAWTQATVRGDGFSSLESEIPPGAQQGAGTSGLVNGSKGCCRRPWGQGWGVRRDQSQLWLLPHRSGPLWV